jgi:hypothetical protein
MLTLKQKSYLQISNLFTIELIYKFNEKIFMKKLTKYVFVLRIECN